MFHTTITQFVRPLLLALTITLFFAACKSGDPGPQGDPGATGAVGPTGPAGPVGATGSANVTQVTFNTAFAPSGSGRVLNLPASINKAMIDKSLVVVYIQNSNNTSLWYQIPGLVLNDDFRYYVNTGVATQTVTIIRASGTSISSVTGVRVLIIPAATVMSGRKAAVDYSNYEAVKAFYNLPD